MTSGYRYKFIRLLDENRVEGRQVYLALNRRGYRRVVKLFRLPRIGQSDPARTLQRAHIELAIGKALRHRNIVRVIFSGDTTDSDEDGSYVIFYIAMKFVNGRTLQDILRKQGPFSLTAAVEIMRQLLDGLAYAHSNGVAAHRDVKPSNIMLTTANVVKILDFGIARLTGSLITQGMALGTPQYMAAEQFLADPPAGPQTDVYAAAAILWEMLTGIPLRNGTYDEIRAQVVSGVLPEMPMSIPQELHSVLTTALSANMADRHKSAAAFWDAIRGAFPELDRTQVMVVPRTDAGLPGALPIADHHEDHEPPRVGRARRSGERMRAADRPGAAAGLHQDTSSPFRSWYQKAEDWAARLGL
jgi:serine/threonine protein kinase